MTEFGELKKGVFPTILFETHADASTEPFWEAARRDKLVAPKCTNCGTFRLPPSPFCFNCQTRDVLWTELPGTGTIHSFTVVRHPLHPGLADCCPYVSGTVELDGTQGAGARMLVNIIDVDPDTVRIGDRVEIVFEHVNDEMSTPRFRPISK
ncbi:MAG: Zn-ribbon domain-containing OB-fold protein [Actinomycetota bacterium]|nr:Zn-ribbon domain-containing OB-fold protein [Actinomycetota bacterium]